MKALTACDKKYLIDYCKEPKNIELALAIGHIQVQLREEILSSFRAKLDDFDGVDVDLAVLVSQ